MMATRHRFLLIALALTLAFGFLGTRGIWDPDEGRYTNVALTMLDSGNWIEPMRNGHTGHWTKPPLTYWLIAASAATFGHTPWAARLPVALAFLACMWLIWRITRHLARGSESLAVVVYATMLLPFSAGHLVTTDFVLAAFQALAMYGFVLFRFDLSRPPQHGLVLMWLGFALGFMTKGPPALMPLLAVVLLHWLVPRPTSCHWRWHLLGVVLFFAVALPWFALVSFRNDGLIDYFLGAELVDRVASNRFERNGQWYGWIAVYLPTILIGTMPWTASLWRWLRTLPALFRTRVAAGDGVDKAAALLLALWVLVPLLVFCLARSRLPLYLLPLFVPMAIAVAMTRQAQGVGMPRGRWLLLWVVLLLGLRLASAYFPTHKDASVWADAIRERAPHVSEVIFVEDMARYGLRLHLGVEVEKVSIAPGTRARFNPSDDETLWDEIKETGVEHGLIYVVKQERWAHVQGTVMQHGYVTRPLGEPFQGRIIFEVETGDGIADSE
ncbi:MAG: glycosyltransferase family 39 protein [Lysobacteraceae bacterium]